MYYWITPELLRPSLTSAAPGRGRTAARRRAWPPSPPLPPEARRLRPARGRRPRPDRAARRDATPRSATWCARNLVEYARVLDEAETMTREEFRERVKDVVVELAATGQTGMGFPKEYGGGGDIGASIAAFETLAFGDLSVLVKVGVQFGLFGGAILQLGTKRHHDAYLADLVTGELHGLLRDDRDRARLQRAGARHRRDVRRGDRGVRDHTRPTTRRARTTSATPRSTPSWRSSSPSSRSTASPTACTRSSSRSARRRAPCCPASGSRTTATRWASTASTTAGSGSTACASRAANLLDRFAEVTADGRLREPDREPQPALLHDARHARPGAGLRRRRRHQRGQGRADDRRRRTPPRGASSRRPTRRTRTLLLDYGLHQRRLFPLLARPTRCTSPRRSWPASCTTSSPGRRDDEHARRELESRAAGTKALGTWHATRTIQECREACGGAGYLGGQPVRRAQGRHRRLHDVRGRQPRAAAAGRQGAADRLRQRVRGPRPVRDGPVRRRRWRSRR